MLRRSFPLLFLWCLQYFYHNCHVFINCSSSSIYFSKYIVIWFRFLKVSDMCHMHKRIFWCTCLFWIIVMLTAYNGLVLFLLGSCWNLCLPVYCNESILFSSIKCILHVQEWYVCCPLVIKFIVLHWIYIIYKYELLFYFCFYSSGDSPLREFAEVAD